MKPTLEDLCQLVGLLLGRPRVQPQDRLLDDLGAESADVINIVATAEEKYHVTLDDEAVAGLSTVADLHALIVQTAP